MPYDKYESTYTVYPLQSGYCKLPLFHVKFNNTTNIGENEQLDTHLYDNLDIDTIVQNMLTNEIFIMPKTNLPNTSTA
jgi:hypothetical protein